MACLRTLSAGFPLAMPFCSALVAVVSHPDRVLLILMGETEGLGRHGWLAVTEGMPSCEPDLTNYSYV